MDMNGLLFNVGLIYTDSSFSMYFEELLMHIEERLAGCKHDLVLG